MFKLELIILYLITNFMIYKNYFRIGKFINVYDIPNKRKIHKKKTPLIGGFILILNYLLFFILINFEHFRPQFTNYLFINFEDIKFYIIFAIPIFLIGFYDDKFDLNPNLKLFLLSLIILLFLYFDKSSVIVDLKFSFIEKTVHVGKFSYLFTVLCYLLFINACNMFDGINLQSSSYFLLFILFISLVGQPSLFTLVLISSLLGFIALNVKGKAFMGDSGVYLYSFTLGFIAIKTYNLNIISDVDTIFILMMVPGIDMLRMFVIRIIKRKNPFRPDNQHIHHLLNYKFNYKKTILILNSMIVAPIILYLCGINNLLLIFFYISFYLIFINSIKKI
tara:strand:+ start:1946 stop:2950 length:1005 start_codon:yes stop_codon:yes gene_type:complete